MLQWLEKNTQCILKLKERLVIVLVQLLYLHEVKVKKWLRTVLEYQRNYLYCHSYTLNICWFKPKPQNWNANQSLSILCLVWVHSFKMSVCQLASWLTSLPAESKSHVNPERRLSSEQGSLSWRYHFCVLTLFVSHPAWDPPRKWRWFN